MISDADPVRMMLPRSRFNAVSIETLNQSLRRRHIENLFFIALSLRLRLVVCVASAESELRRKGEKGFVCK